jgi:putative ABC transport system substrate-binding protein
MRRRDFITILGGAAAWPLAAHAQQPAMPMVGFISSTSSDGNAALVDEFRRGLVETGLIEGRSVAIEFRWADNQYERLPLLVADLVQRRAAVIFAYGAVNGPTAAKRATTTIPIVFLIGSDPVEVGLVASLNRPGGNLTGMTLFVKLLLAKRLELLRELVPNINTIGLLVNPRNPNTEQEVRDMQGWRMPVDGACGSSPPVSKPSSMPCLRPLHSSKRAHSSSPPMHPSATDATRSYRLR